MRTLSELKSVEDPAWPELQEWIAGAKNSVEVLAPNEGAGDATLEQLQVTARSMMGAVGLETGGLFVDGGWLRILGAPSPRMIEGLNAWNGRGQPAIANPPLDDALIVAHDVVGGFFALNGGAFDGEPGHVFYFAPDSLDWEDLEIGYSDFLGWAFEGDLEKFYESSRWPGWRDEVATLAGDRGFSIAPPLWTREGKNVAECSRKPVPMRELWALAMDVRRQLAAAD